MIIISVISISPAGVGGPTHKSFPKKLSGA